MPTVLPAAYSHTIDGFSKGIDEKSPWYRVVFHLDNWSDTDAFMNALMGFGTASGPTSGPTVTRGVPHAHPLSPNLYCSRTSVIQGLGNPVLNPAGYPDYDDGALVEAEYRPPPFDFGGGGVNFLNNQIDPGTPLSWCTQEVDFGHEVITIPGGTMYRYTSGPDSGKFTGVPMKIFVPITILTLTFHKLPYMPLPQLRLLRGRVNSTTFLGSPAGTVLFKGGKTSREPNPDGSIVQTVTEVFEERDSSQPWNSEPGLGSATFYPVEGTGSVTKYPVADLSPLLQF
jgi:hypothetical protein